jgi:hypothetical protein
MTQANLELEWDTYCIYWGPGKPTASRLAILLSSMRNWFYLFLLAIKTSNKYYCAPINVPITVAARSKAWTVFARSNPTQKAWMLVCVFILCLCCPVCRQRPCDGLITRPRCPRACVKKRLQNWRRDQGPTKGCNANDEWMNEFITVVNEAWSRSYPGLCLDGLKKPRKTSVSLAGAPTVTRTKHLHNTYLELYF